MNFITNFLQLYYKNDKEFVSPRSEIFFIIGFDNIKKMIGMD